MQLCPLPRPVGRFFAMALVCSLSGFLQSCFLFQPSRRHKDISYVAPDAPDFAGERHRLDVYVPRRQAAEPRPVVLFIHGGSWRSGNKNTYTFIGRRLAKKGRSSDAVVAVILNYRLAPSVQVPAMADDCARAVKWVLDSISAYGGNPDKIYVMGHSAGGGLAALLATKAELFRRQGVARNPVKGALLNDPGGLDMYDYLQKMEYPGDESYLVPFGKDPAGWRDVSPLYFIDANDPPMLLFVGGRTYPSIASSSRTFRDRLQAVGVPYQFTEMPRKKHIPMVTQLFWKNNRLYRDLHRLISTGR